MNEDIIPTEPIILYDDDTSRGAPIKTSTKKQDRLLQGIVIHPDNLRAAARFAGIHTMADAYRTLDRLSLRKDYQMGLASHGVNLDFIISELKSLALAADLDSTRVKVLQIFLKSLGLDSYGKEEEGVQGWEKTLTSAVSKQQQQPKLNSARVPYEVKLPPPPPDDIQESRSLEAELGKELYNNE